VPVSADLTACFLPTNPRKNAASRRENANSGERQTLCWRRTGFELLVRRRVKLVSVVRVFETTGEAK